MAQCIRPGISFVTTVVSKSKEQVQDRKQSPNHAVSQNSMNKSTPAVSNNNNNNNNNNNKIQEKKTESQTSENIFLGKCHHSSDSLVEPSSKVQHAECASLSSAMSHVEGTDDLPSLSCSVSQDIVPASTSSEEVVGAVALADSGDSAGVTLLACSYEQVRDPSPTSSEGLIKLKLKNKKINILLLFQITKIRYLEMPLELPQRHQIIKRSLPNTVIQR